MNQATGDIEYEARQPQSDKNGDDSLPFVGLPDPTYSVLKLYGREVNLFKLGRMPAQALIDREGTARFVHDGHSMQDIPENAEILALADDINASEGVPA